MKKLKITSVIFYSIYTALLLIVYFSALPDLINSDDGWNALGGVILMIYSLIGCAIYLVPIILSIIGLCKNKNLQNEVLAKKNARFFWIMIILPILTTALNFIAYMIVLKN